MQPYRPLVFDNRPQLPVFLDGSPLTDGMANFATSLIQAPQQAAEVRHAREREQLEDLWREKAFGREQQADEMNRLWHDQASQRQDRLDQGQAAMQKAQIDHLNSDSTRRWMEDLGKAANSLFGAAKGGTGQRAGWAMFTGEDGKPYLYNRGDGSVMPAKLPGAAPAAAAARAPAAGGGNDFWSMRRSGAPGGPQTAGDVLGLRWYGSGDQAAPAAAGAPAPQLDMANLAHHAQNIADLYQRGDRASAQSWIAQMRAEHGDAFTDAVKDRVRQLVATPAPADAGAQPQAP